MKISVSFSVLVLFAFSQCQAENMTFADDDNDTRLGDPWETPFQELVRISPVCIRQIENFDKILWTAEVAWQKCMDFINPHIPRLDQNSTGDKVNASVYHDIESKVHMSICHNKTAFKSCWAGIIESLNLCKTGAGDVAGKLYFALYDDICRDGGKPTIEIRRKAEAQGRLCERNYSTEACIMNKRLKKTDGFYDLCRRFKSNVACDQSSIDPGCTNTVDKTSHTEIFQRVGKQLNCSNVKDTRDSSWKYGASSGIIVRPWRSGNYGIVSLAVFMMSLSVKLF